VIAHRCKDMSAIQRLRELKNPKLASRMSSLFERLKEPFRRKLKLPNVTAWGCVWSEDAEYFQRTLRVLRYCNKIVQFERTVLFSYLTPPKDYEGEYVQIPRLPNVDQFNILVNKTVPKYLEGEFSCALHEDGAFLDTSLWENEFLRYDFVGAPWRDGVVGNGGFCIESKRFNHEKMKLPPYVPGKIVASDFYVARVHREALLNAGMKFAPADVAERFSTETTGHNKPSLGFHGKRHAVAKYNFFWRLVSASEKEAA
jgi:hypothetical protein